VPTAAPRILLVNDDPPLTRLVDAALIAEGWTTSCARDAHGALDAAVRFRPDIAVLDMVLPDLDGLQAMRRLRGHHPDLPVLFLTAAGGIDHLVRALSAGADDYVVRPFSLPELVSRLRALLRRTRPSGPLTHLSVGDLTLHEDSRQVRRAGRPVELSVAEFDLLRYLMINAGRVLSTEKIRERVWQFDRDAAPRVAEYIARLRRKLAGSGPALIHTVRGVGYILEARPMTHPRD